MSFEFGLPCRQRCGRLTPGCLQPLGGLGFRRRHLGRMRRARVMQRVDLNGEVVLERAPTRFSFFEVTSHLRERDIVLLHRRDEHLRRFCLRLPYGGLNLRGRLQLQIGLLRCKRGARVAPGCLEPPGCLRLQCRDLSRMYRVRLMQRVDLNGEVPLQRASTRFHLFKVTSHLRQRGIVLRLELSR